LRITGPFCTYDLAILDQAPDIATKYWGLKPGAGMRDLLLAVRADEAGEKATRLLPCYSRECACNEKQYAAPIIGLKEECRPVWQGCDGLHVSYWLQYRSCAC
jgi:Alternative oxidase